MKSIYIYMYMYMVCLYIYISSIEEEGLGAFWGLKIWDDVVEMFPKGRGSFMGCIGYHRLSHRCLKSWRRVL